MLRDETRDGWCVKDFEGRSSTAGSTYENVLPKRRGVLTSTSDGQRSHPLRCMITGACVAQSAR